MNNNAPNTSSPLILTAGQVESLAAPGFEAVDIPVDTFNDSPPVAASGGFASNLFDFSVSVFNGADARFNEFIDMVGELTSAALSNWAQYIVGAEGAVLDVQVTIADLSPSTVASAGSASFSVEDPNAEGIVDLQTGAQVELQTGVDINGEIPDVFINVNTRFLESATAFLETDPDRVLPNARSIDYVSVLTHEIAHGLGFISLRDNTGNDFIIDIDGDGDTESVDTTYGTLVNFSEVDGETQATFNGQNVIDVYGQPVLLETTTDSPGSDVSHFARFREEGGNADTITALENPNIIRGDIVTIGALELAVMADLGYEVRVPSDLGLVNQIDSFDPPTVSVSPTVAFFEGLTYVTLVLDQLSSQTSTQGTVGVEIVGADGEPTVFRAIFNPGDGAVTIGLDSTVIPTTVDDNGITRVLEDIDVRLFYPAQLQLADGAVEQTVSLSTNIIAGTDGNDRLVGTSEDDFQRGDDGNDVLWGSLGADVLGGDGGFDRVTYQRSDAGVSVNLETREGSGGFAEGDVLDSIEWVLGSRFDDTLIGTSNTEFLLGGAGNDELRGGDGDDALRGDAGADIVDGGLGTDRASYSTSNSAVSVDLGTGVNSGGHAEGDTLISIEGVNGSNFDDRIIGDGGANTINGNGGNDVIAGRAGDDRLEGRNGNDRIWGNDGNDVLVGGNGNDGLNGGNGNDRLFGQNGNDNLNGQAGNDVFIGGAGNDSMFGGTGSDRFIFNNGDGSDTIRDFELGTDRLHYKIDDISFADLDFVDTGNNVRISVSDISVTLSNINSEELTSSDFLFT